MKFFFVSSSPSKTQHFAQLFQKTRGGDELVSLPLVLPEVQSCDVRVVARTKIAAAGGLTPERPLFIDDTGVEIDGLVGFPGALLAPLLRQGGISLLDTLTRGVQKNGKVRARVVTAVALLHGSGVSEGFSEVWGTLDFTLRERFADVDCTAMFFLDGETVSQAELGRTHPERMYAHRWEAFHQALRDRQ